MRSEQRISALIEQRGVDLGRREIHEVRLVQDAEDRRALCRTEGARRGRASPRGTLGPPSAIERRARQRERSARRRNTESGADLGDRLHQESSVSSGVPSNAAMFFGLRSRLRRVRRACAIAWSHAQVRRSACLGRPRPPSRAHASLAWARPAPRAPAPRRQVRGVQALPSQQRPNCARRLTPVRFADDLPFVFYRESPPGCLRRDFDLRPMQGLLSCAHQPPILARPRH